MIDKLTSNYELKQKMLQDFLFPLAVKLKQSNGGNRPITLAEFRKIVNNTNFDRIKKSLNEGGIINIANDDVVFQYDFLYEYFLNCAETSDADRIEARLRTCKSTDLTKLFLSYIPHNEPFHEYGKDAVEIAVDIINDERDSFKMTESEERKVIDLMTQKLRSCNDARQRASILNGIGKLFGRLDFIRNEDEFFDINNRIFWCENGDGTLLSTLPITFYYFNIFIQEGYQQERFWEYGRESIVMKDGGLRIRPLKIDDGVSCVFEIANHPVVGVTWYEANAFCKWLQTKLGNNIQVSLPSVSQIETFFSDELLSSGRYNAKNGQCFESTTPVSTFFENHCSPVDIVGNVWEWSNDVFDFHGDGQSYTTVVSNVWMQMATVHRNHTALS